MGDLILNHLTDEERERLDIALWELGGESLTQDPANLVDVLIETCEAVRQRQEEGDHADAL